MHISETAAATNNPLQPEPTVEPVQAPKVEEAVHSPIKEEEPAMPPYGMDEEIDFDSLPQPQSSYRAHEFKQDPSTFNDQGFPATVGIKEDG